MRILIIGDLHGALPKIHFEEFDCIIMPGDICGDQGIREYVQESLHLFYEDPQNAKEWWQLAGKRKAKKLIKESLAKARATLELMNEQGVPVYLIPGNWDWTGRNSTWEYLHQDLFSPLFEDLEHVQNIDGCLVDIGGIDVLGYGHVSGPELLRLRGETDLTEEELAEDEEEYELLKEAYFEAAQAADNPLIVLAHNVPYKTKLDKINNPDSPKDGWHFGSVLARDLIESYKPLLCIGGHMHETFGGCKVKKTVCLNAGFGAEKNILVEIKNEKLKQVAFHPASEIVVKL